MPSSHLPDPPCGRVRMTSGAACLLPWGEVVLSVCPIEDGPVMGGRPPLAGAGTASIVDQTTENRTWVSLNHCCLPVLPCASAARCQRCCLGLLRSQKRFTFVTFLSQKQQKHSYSVRTCRFFRCEMQKRKKLRIFVGRQWWKKQKKSNKTSLSPPPTPPLLGEESEMKWNL